MTLSNWLMLNSVGYGLQVYMNYGWKDVRSDNCSTVIPSTTNNTGTDLRL